MQTNGLNANQKRALTALLTSPSLRAAAIECKLSERTLYNYLQEPAFRAELRARQDAILASVTSALVGLSGEAVRVLRSVLNAKTATDAVKVRAALGWLRHTRDAMELADLAGRVSALEKKIGGG